jgi:hypothetical protein
VDARVLPTRDVLVQIVRLRLAPAGGFVYLARFGEVPIEGVDGSERLFSEDGRILAARRPDGLRDAIDEAGVSFSELPMLLLDVRGTGRRIVRPESRWPGLVRGSVVAFNDLVFDAAATLGDELMVTEAQSGVLHAMYAYVWGDLDEAPPARQRAAAWASAAQWLDGHLVLRENAC